MSVFFSFFKRQNPKGDTTRNAYLEKHGYYLSLQKRKAVGTNGHSAPIIPYVIFDLIRTKITKDCSTFARWNIATYRWALHHLDHAASCRIALKKNSGRNHRHFIRDEEKTAEEIRNYSNDHRKHFDLIIFDGPDKHDEVENITNMLKDNGVIIMVDDFTNPYDFDQALSAFKANGFKTLELINPAPMFDTLTGAIIYREKNFLDI